MSAHQHKKRATWAMKFSMDGRYLAAAGQDAVVRVFKVLSTPQERTSEEGLRRATEVSAGGCSLGRNSKKGKGPPTNCAPVFLSEPIREYRGHTSDVLDLSWSKGNFLASSSMDKTVRLWHVSRPECLCTFGHLDFVTGVAFHPKDDRFFLSGSLDGKLRLWK